LITAVADRDCGKPTLATTYVFGNALIAVQMTTYDAVQVFTSRYVCSYRRFAERRVTVTYDLPSAAMRQFACQQSTTSHVRWTTKSSDCSPKQSPAHPPPSRNSSDHDDVYAPNDLLRLNLKS